jgi:HlyD family secretion protein
MSTTKSPFRRFRWLIILGILALIALGIGIAKKKGLILKEPPTEVLVSTVSLANIVETVTATGKIQPEVEVKISPDVSGEIIALYVEEGQAVKQGQLLLKIRPDNYQSYLERAQAAVNGSKAQLEQSKAAVAQTEARLEKAMIDFNRNKNLHDQKVISDADFDTFTSQLNIAKQDLESARASKEAARFNVLSSEANLKEAAENLRRTNIYAPMSGTISALNVELGERVVGTSQMAGTEMLRIANLNQMEVRVNVNENDITRVQEGDSVLIDVDSYSANGKKFKGLVYEVASSSNSTASAAGVSSNVDAVTEFEVKIKVLPSSYQELVSEGTKFPLKPGMTASVDIITDTRKQVVSIPLIAVTTRDPNAQIEEKSDKKEGKKDDEEAPKTTKKSDLKEVVFLYDNGKAKLQVVQTGITDSENIEVKNGLKVGDRIISGPYNLVSKTLNNGDKVNEKGKKPVEKK